MKHLENSSDNKTFNHIISGPFIYGLGIALVLFHIVLEIYHQAAFRLYNLELVDYQKYIKIDRYKLSKLTFLQKINCVYCGYANGLLAYAVVIAAETEKYWCGIKHDVTTNDCKLIEPNHHENFAEYQEYK
jgi:hypothetical protein